VKKPLISAKNRRARVSFAKKHINWTKQQWKEIIWSDESKFSLFGSNEISCVRRPIGKRHHHQYQIPTVLVVVERVLCIVLMELWTRIST
jgi:hypothetical protein